MSDQDQTLACKDCRIDFTFTVGEAAFYAEKGFQVPRRCKACRVAKKAQDQGNNYAAGAAPAEPQPPALNHKKGGRRDDRDDRY
jgi:hypothetical protein